MDPGHISRQIKYKNRHFVWLRKRNKILLLLCIFILLTSLLLISCSSDKNHNKTDIELNKQEIDDQEISEMAARHSAVDLGDVFKDKDGILNELMTIEIQEFLESNSGKYFLLDGVYLTDVFKRDNTYYASFEKWPNIAQLNISLQMNNEFKSGLLKNREFLSSYAIVMDIINTYRPDFFIEANPISNDEAEIKLNSQAQLVIKGNLVDYYKCVSDIDTTKTLIK